MEFWKSTVQLLNVDSYRSAEFWFPSVSDQGANHVFRVV